MRVESYPPGTPSWVDLITTDLEGAKRFYGGLLGWSFDDRPTSQGSVYAMALLQGDPVAGLAEMGEGQRSQGMPPMWNSYVTVADVDGVTAKVEPLGGAIAMAPMDVEDAGRMAFVRDTEGATFALWQPRNHVGAGRVNEPGAYCWNELYTRDLDGARAFYEQLLRWDAEPGPEQGPPMRTFKRGDRYVADAIEIQPDWGGMPPSWMVYFAVADLDAALAKARELGGESFTEPMDIPVGRFAGVKDPQGAHCFLIQLREAG